MLTDTQEIHTTTETPHKHSPLYLLTGLILGLVLGLAYAWVINPVIYEHTTPASLAEVDKDFYRSTIAQVYAATGDLERAVLRLALLEDPNPVSALGVQAQQVLAEGQDAQARALALLASVLQSAPNLQKTQPGTLPPQPTPTEALPAIPTHTLPVPTATP